MKKKKEMSLVNLILIIISGGIIFTTGLLLAFYTFNEINAWIGIFLYIILFSALIISIVKLIKKNQNEK